MKVKGFRICAVLVLPLFLLLSSCATMGIEKPKYTVVEKQGKFEIRSYAPQILAETTVDATFEDAGNVAFRRLFKYISGDNRSRTSIAMTAPVNQQAQSKKIAMTAPVNQQKLKDGYAVSFVMPAKYTIDILPEPLDPSVSIREVPARTLAAIRYSGTWSIDRYNNHLGKLQSFVKEKGLRIIDEPIFARYDPPFQIWFLRRNEVLIPVE